MRSAGSSRSRLLAFAGCALPRGADEALEERPHELDRAELCDELADDLREGEHPAVAALVVRGLDVDAAVVHDDCGLASERHLRGLVEDLDAGVAGVGRARLLLGQAGLWVRVHGDGAASSRLSQESMLEGLDVMVSATVVNGTGEPRIHAALIGVYQPTGNLYNGKQLFRMRQASPSEPDTWLRFTKDNDWVFSSTANKDGQTTKGMCISMQRGMDHPTQVDGWKFDKDQDPSKSEWEINVFMAPPGIPKVSSTRTSPAPRDIEVYEYDQECVEQVYEECSTRTSSAPKKRAAGAGKAPPPSLVLSCLACLPCLACRQRP